MPRLLSFLCLFFILLSAQAQASVDRLTALGGLSQAILDDSNGFIFPATLGEWPRFEVELFDEWAGVAYPLSVRHTFGLFFNRPTANLSDFSTYIQQNGSDLFRAMAPSPWFDMAYSYAPNQTIAIGAATSLAYDRSVLATRETSATSADLRFGLRIGSGPILDIGFAVLLRRLQDQTLEGVKFTQTDGTGLVLDIRYRWPLSPRITVLPYFGYARDAFALAPTEQTRTAMRIGSGLQLKPVKGILVIAAIDSRLERTDQTNTPPFTDERILLLPAWILGGEARVGSMLFRLGVRHESWLVDTKRFRADQWVKSSSFTTTFNTHLGLGIEFANLLLDGLIESDFLRDGPHFIGGSRHGGGILSHLSLTYRFNSPSE